MDIRLDLLNDSIDIPVVKVEGDINILTAGIFREALMKIVSDSKNSILVDCKALEYIDSNGLTVLVDAMKVMQQKELHINLLNVRNTIMKLLCITHMDKQFIANS